MDAGNIYRYLVVKVSSPSQRSITHSMGSKCLGLLFPGTMWLWKMTGVSVHNILQIFFKVLHKSACHVNFTKVHLVNTLYPWEEGKDFFSSVFFLMHAGSSSAGLFWVTGVCTRPNFPSLVLNVFHTVRKFPVS